MLISLFILLIVLVAAVGAPWLAPYSPRKMDIAHRLAAPSAGHWFGTDEFGRDVLSRCMFGAQLSLTVGFLVVIASLICGTTLGVVSGYVRQLDGLLMRVTDALMAFPDILLAIALMAALGASLTDVAIALSPVYAARCARCTRRSAGAAGVAIHRGGGSARRHRWADHHRAPAAQPAFAAIGAGHVRFRLLHSDRGALSFLGAGVPPTSPTWGNMIATAQEYMQNADWLILAPGLCIVLTVLALQAVGDGLRDALEYARTASLESAPPTARNRVEEQPSLLEHFQDD